jgi:hypothetical protein
MLILFDQGAPRGVARVLHGHKVITARERGWDRLVNGALLREAEQAGVDILFTTDRNLRYQQNLSGRRISIVVLVGTTKWSKVRLHLERISAIVNDVRPGSYVEVDIPFIG